MVTWYIRQKSNRVWTGYDWRNVIGLGDYMCAESQCHSWCFVQRSSDKFCRAAWFANWQPNISIACFECSLVQHNSTAVLRSFDLNWTLSTFTTVPPISPLCTHTYVHIHIHTHIHPSTHPPTHYPNRCQSWPPIAVLHRVAFSLCSPTPTLYSESKCQHHTHTHTHTL